MLRAVPTDLLQIISVYVCGNTFYWYWLRGKCRRLERIKLLQTLMDV